MPSDAARAGKLQYADYVCFPDDGRRHEVVDGDHIVNPAPSTYHQTVSKRLQYQLYTQIELAGLGIVFDAPVDVQLSDFDIVQPDLVVILNARKSIITPIKVKGIPDLIVEILSPSSLEHDRRLKKQLYEKSGIPEYWIADPFEHVLEQFVLRDGDYRLEPACNELVPAFIPQVKIQLEDVW